MDEKKVKGRLIVTEGPDASGRSTQVTMLTPKLEADGHAVLNTGLRRSELISEGILEAKRNLVLGKRTLSLFYAADFADQLENIYTFVYRKSVLSTQYNRTYITSSNSTTLRQHQRFSVLLSFPRLFIT